MRIHLGPCWILACAAFLSMAFSPGEARARACAVAGDCPSGFDCEPSGTASDGGATGSCVSLPCQSDSDCGTGTRCYINSGTTTCLAAADGGSSCSSNMCVPQWQAPCSADANCGPGFTCSGTGGYDQFVCGSNHGASIPPYATTTSIACPKLPPLPNPLPPGFIAPFTCDAGPGSCLSVSWSTCVAQQTSASCTVDSDCPSTWTCQCQMTCGFSSGGPEISADASGNTSADASASAADSGCTNACLAPNSDLALFQGCLGGAGSNGGNVIAPAPALPEGGADSSTAGPSVQLPTGEEPASGATRSSSSNGGCQVGAGDRTTGWTLGAIGAFAWASRRSLRRRRRLGH